MNTTINFMPNADVDRLIWLSNFKIKLPMHAALVGITPTEVLSVENDYNMFEYIINMTESYKQTTNQIVAYKALFKHAQKQQHLSMVPVLGSLAVAPLLVEAGAFDRISGLAQRIKAHPAYTTSIGIDLGIVAPKHVVDTLTMQPVLKIKLDAGHPHIKCARGKADAIDLFVDRKDGNNFVLLGRLLKLNYIDVAALTEAANLQEWHYKGIYVMGNDWVGRMSNVVSIVVKRM